MWVKWPLIYSSDFTITCWPGKEGKGLVSMVQALDERTRDWPSSITALLKGAGINKNLKKKGR